MPKDVGLNTIIVLPQSIGEVDQSDPSLQSDRQG